MDQKDAIVLIKVSGDLREAPELAEFVRDKMSEGRVVVVTGGGTDITKAIKAEFPDYVPDFRIFGRYLTDPRQEAIRRRVLEENQQQLIQAFRDFGIKAGSKFERDVEVVVTIPYIDLGPFQSPVTGEWYVFGRAYHWRYKSVYILTLPERVEKKKKEVEEIINLVDDGHREDYLYFLYGDMNAEIKRKTHVLPFGPGAN